MSLNQKLLLISMFLLLFSSCATIKESVKNDDVLLKTYTVKENTGYQYEVAYRFKDAPLFNDVALNISVKKYQMCKTNEMGIYDRTELIKRKAIYKDGSSLSDCYSDAVVLSIIGIGILKFPVCITDSFRAMDSTQHAGRVTKTINSYAPERCGELSPAGTQVSLSLNNGVTFTKNTDAAGNATFSINELGEPAKEFHDRWASLKVDNIEKDLSIPEAIQYHWIDRDYKIALKQGTVEGYLTFLQTDPQSKYVDVITEKLVKEAWKQTKKAEREKDWHSAYNYCEVVDANYNGQDAFAREVEKELDKIKNALMNDVNSKEEAYEVFPPEQFSYSDLLTDPYKLNDKIIEIRGVVLQRAEAGVYLINIGNYIIYVTCFSNHCLRAELQGGGFVAGAPVRILGQVEGAHTYNTAVGTTNTVPWLSGIWMESLR